MTDGFNNLDDDDEWDEAFAESLIGRTLLVGLTLLTHDDQLIERRQIFGVVESCHPTAGIAIRERKTGEVTVIAPVLDAIEFGDPGIYQLRDADEVVEDPDFIASITGRQPHRH
jgi:hypothetical protein